jgi:hypothetical protein
LESRLVPMADNEYNKSSAPVKTKTNMKKLVLLLTLTLTALPAFADLGFTYDQVVKEMGGVKGTPTKLDGWKLPNWVWWPPKGPHCAEFYFQFNNHRVVSIFESCATPLLERSIQYTLDHNGFNWHEYEAVSPVPGDRYLCTADNTVYAHVSDGGKKLSVTYKSWLDATHSWAGDNGDKDSPPLEQETEPESKPLVAPDFADPNKKAGI